MMSSREILILLICVGLCCTELQGPESQKNKVEDEEKTEAADDVDTDLLNELTNPLSEKFEEVKGLVEYMAALKELKKVMQGKNTDKEKPDSEIVKEYLESVKLGSSTLDPNAKSLDEFLSEESNKKLTELQKKVSVTKPSNFWMPNIEKVQETNKKILDLFETSVPEDDEELTPEMKKAKEMYEEALYKVSRKNPDGSQAIELYEASAQLGYIPARIKMAWLYIHGEGIEMNVDKAREIFQELADEGNGDAHAGLGFMYATGTGVPVSQAKALVYYSMGSAKGSTYAMMALAYRMWSGHTIKASCPTAMNLYKKVAAKVVSQVSLSGGPAAQRIRILDELEGTGTGGTLDTDLIEYYQLLAEKGDVQAQIGLGQLHLHGGRGVSLDVDKALRYFQQAAKSGSVYAEAFLGKIYLEGGDGLAPNNDMALHYFKKAAERNNPIGQSGLGLMHLQGRGVAKDPAMAFKYFTLAANHGWAEGQLHLGLMYFNGAPGVRRDLKQANKYFSLASQSGHVLAYYFLAVMHAEGLGVMPSCPTAVELLKSVCERGPWSNRLMKAHSAWRNGRAVHSFQQYVAMAELGYEVAQTNAATLLDTGEVQYFPVEERWARALQLWGRSASQGYSSARVKVGDYHYYGQGTKQDLEAAAHHYRIASERQNNAQAMFNLGYMHERGLGLSRDVHLAKRCYDLAADASPDARLPAALALVRLYAAVTLDNIKDSLVQSPLSLVFMNGDSLLSNWDLYLITGLTGALILVLYLRRQENEGNN